MIRNGILRLDFASIGIDEVYQVSNGDEAAELLKSVAMDIAILDIRMPGKTGVELAQMLHERAMDTAVILLTGFSEFEYARDALRAGVAEYLLKPLAPAELLETVRRVKEDLEQRRSEKEKAKQFDAQPPEDDLRIQVERYFERTGADIRAVVRDLAAQHTDSTLSMASLADAHHMASGHLSRKLRQETGYSYTELINAIRLTHAYRLLLQGVRVGDVPEQTGFSDRHYFSSLFHRVFRMQPSGVRGTEEDPPGFGVVIERMTKAKESADA